MSSNHFVGLLQGEGKRLECVGTTDTGILAQAGCQDVVVLVAGRQEGSHDHFEIWVTINCDDETCREDILAGVITQSEDGKYVFESYAD